MEMSTIFHLIFHLQATNIYAYNDVSHAEKVSVPFTTVDGFLFCGAA